jgi:hypothetical protein
LAAIGRSATLHGAHNLSACNLCNEGIRLRASTTLRKGVSRVSGRTRKLAAMLIVTGALLGNAAAALGDAPGPGSKPQCAGGPANGNPHCPQNK